MTKQRKLTTEEKIANMKLAFSNAQTPEILEVLQTVGYTQEKLQEYLEATNEVERLTQNQKKEYGEQYSKTAEFDEKRAEANKVYKRYLALARIAFKKDVEATTTLELTHSRKQAYSSWLKQVNNFYAQLLNNDAFLEKMLTLNVKQEDIVQAQAGVEAVETLKQEQKQEMGEAQKATEIRDNAFDELYPHYSEMIELAKVLLEDEQLLESIGIVVKR